jgi:GGDEF domain-containing protein
MRVLLHAARLDLAVRDDESWCHLVAREGADPELSRSDASAPAREVLASRTSALGQEGSSDSMATPLVAGSELLGVLTAEQRLGAARGFDMRDLRLLETVGAELSMALERGRLLADLERAATTDALTNLPNLVECTRQLAELLDGADGVVLAAVAVDSFREVNDTLGHVVGDELLLEVTRRLLLASPSAVVGRIGGGRFAVAVPAGAAGGDPEMFGLGLRRRSRAPPRSAPSAPT